MSELSTELTTSHDLYVNGAGRGALDGTGRILPFRRFDFTRCFSIPRMSDIRVPRHGSATQQRAGGHEPCGQSQVSVPAGLSGND